MRKPLAEAAGTYALVLCGTGAIAYDEVLGGTLGTIGIALAFGLIVATMVMVFAGVSGAHINPAVTIALATGDGVARARVFPYIGSQLIGALLASLTVRALFPSSVSLGATHPAGAAWISFALELLLTFLLMLVILVIAKRPRWLVALAVGGTVGLEAYLAGPLTGASMNPARSIAPAVITGNMEHLWIYIAAPIIGALAAVGTWRLLK